MKFAILGGGLTGMTAALRLQESPLTGGSEIIVLEEQEHPGGLLRTTRRNGYYWDNGVFVFKESNYLCRLFPDLFLPVEDHTQKAWVAGGIHDFPLAKSLVRRMSKFALLATAFDYLYSYLRCSLGWDGDTLNDWLRYRLTARLLQVSRLEAYVAKLQGRPSTELSPRLAELRLQSVHDMTRPGRLLQALLASPSKIQKMKKMLGGRLVYPYGGGVGEISSRLAQLCQARGVKIFCGARVTGLTDQEAAGLEIRYEGTHGPEMCRVDGAISTIPLEELAAAYGPPVPEAARAAARQLEYMDLKLLFFLVKRPLIHHKFFILYSLEEHQPWKRLLCLALPDGLNAVTVEVAYNPSTGPVGTEVEEAVTAQLTGELGLFAPEEILARHATVVRRAYPIYRLGAPEEVNDLINRLESRRLRLAGRQGRFLYVSTPGAVDSATEAAAQIIQGLGEPMAGPAGGK